jgi:hypothetical protein
MGKVGIKLHCQFQGLFSVKRGRTKEAVMAEVLPGGSRENINPFSATRFW